MLVYRFGQARYKFPQNKTKKKKPIILQQQYLLDIDKDPLNEISSVTGSHYA